jgi:hypothetical protein
VRFGLLLLVGVVLVAAGCGGGGSDKRHTSVLTATGATPIPTTGTSTSQVEPTRIRFHYPRDSQRVFLVNCVRNGGSTAICACTLHQLQEKMPVAQFDRVANALAGKRKPPAVLQARIRRIGIQCARSSS